MWLLQYSANDEPIRKTEFTHATQLKTALEIPSKDPSTKLKLYVVEDLSREVIELFGSKFEIDPAFFREHIMDHAWYNIRDFWRDPPSLNVVARGQNWFQIRFVRARYFETGNIFRQAFRETEDWNVVRRPDEDENNLAFWDKADARVGMTRSRASFWMRRSREENESAVGKHSWSAYSTM